MLGEYHDGIDGNIFSKHNDQEKKTLVKRMADYFAFPLLL
jgi:hypothetical protein